MKFKELTFQDQHAERIYKDYIGRVKNSIKTLNNDNQNETLLEINSHIYEALQASAANEKENLSDILQKRTRGRKKAGRSSKLLQSLKNTESTSFKLWKRILVYYILYSLRITCRICFYDLFKNRQSRAHRIFLYGCYIVDIGHFAKFRSTPERTTGELVHSGYDTPYDLFLCSNNPIVKIQKEIS